MKIKTLTYKGTLYFHRADLIEYLREFGATEETDVRARLDALIDNLNGPIPGADGVPA